MAEKLPKFMVIKSVLFSGYACYSNESTVLGYVFCQEKSVFSPFAKLEVEQAKNDKNYVHLRFCHSNKYWARRGPGADDHWIVAGSDQPEEDTSKLSCTLFEPKFGNEGLLYLTHLQSGKRVRTDNGKMATCVYVDDEDKLGDPVREYGFTYVDCDTLVKIPKRVTFIGDNEKYLKAVWYGTPWSWTNGIPCLQFSGADYNHEYVAYEVHPLPDGHLRIKSEHFGRFLRRGYSNWILGDSTDESGKDVDTLFWPVKVDDRTIALRCAGNNQLFCKRFTDDGKDECLSAAVSRITKEARLVVEELVLERSIYNVRYRMEDARVFDEKPFVVGIGTATNDADTDASLTIKVAYEDTSSYTFSNSVSIKAGVKTTIETGIPFIVDGKLDVSLEVGFSFQWDRTTEEKKKAEASYTVEVPARTKVIVNYVATHGKCSVPFSYTQRDKNSSDGQFITGQHIDGIYYGVNYYSFRFEQPKMEALPR